jgi:hypothetical protein
MNPASLVIDVPAWSRETQRSGRTPMLKTIRRFVLERSRDVHRKRRPISEDDDMREPSDASEAPQQSAEPQLDEPPAPTVWGKVKWYNPLKGTALSSSRTGPAMLSSTPPRSPTLASALSSQAQDLSSVWLLGNGVPT